MARSRHPNKEIEAAVRHAEALGWRVIVGGSHAWGFLLCLEKSRDGCRLHVLSTPRNPEGFADKLLRRIKSCTHEKDKGDD